jgi:hypothetical protein
MIRHMCGHLLLAVAWLSGAAEAELAPRYARMPCRHGRLLRGKSSHGASGNVGG